MPWGFAQLPSYAQSSVRGATPKDPNNSLAERVSCTCAPAKHIASSWPFRDTSSLRVRRDFTASGSNLRLDVEDAFRQLSLVWHRRDLAGLSGALVRVNGLCCIVTNIHQSWTRQRFTAAHEFKHYLTDRHLAPVSTCSQRLDTAIERAVNVFARELLMPPETCGLYDKGFCAPEEIGRVLGVSAQAAGLRMAELGLGKEQVWWG